MRVVHKFEVSLTDEEQVVPAGRVVHFGRQPSGGDRLFVWIERHEGFDAKMALRVFGTGHSVPIQFTHCSTIVDEYFVWHLYWRMTS